MAENDYIAAGRYQVRQAEQNRLAAQRYRKLTDLILRLKEDRAVIEFAHTGDIDRLVDSLPDSGDRAKP